MANPPISLKEKFNPESKVPMNLSTPVVKSAANVLKDPGVTKLLKDSNAVVLTHREVDGMLPVNPSTGSTPGQQLLRPAQDTNGNNFAKMYTALQGQHPELTNRLDAALKREDLNDPRQIDIDRNQLLQQLSDPKESFVRVIGDQKETSPLIVAKLDDEKAMDRAETMYSKDTLGKSQTVKPPPGRPQEWTALINMHEMGHLANNRQQPLKDYFNNLSGADAQNYQLSLAQAREAEADMGAIHSLRGKISPEVTDRLIADRIASSSPQHLLNALGQAKWISSDEATSPSSTNIATAHETGFIDAEYNSTGQVPDIHHLNAATDGFYKKSAQSYADQLKDRLKAEGINIHDPNSTIPDRGLTVKKGELIKPVDQDVMMSIVNQGLLKDTYQPPEQNIAHHYLNSMNELGVKPRPLDQAFDERIKDIRQNLSPAIAPTTTMTQTNTIKPATTTATPG